MVWLFKTNWLPANDWCDERLVSGKSSELIKGTTQLDWLTGRLPGSPLLWFIDCMWHSRPEATLVFLTNPKSNWVSCRHWSWLDRELSDRCQGGPVALVQLKDINPMQPPGPKRPASKVKRGCWWYINPDRSPCRRSVSKSSGCGSGSRTDLQGLCTSFLVISSLLSSYSDLMHGSLAS